MKYHREIFMILLILARYHQSLGSEGVNFLDFIMSSSAHKLHNISFSPDDGKKFRQSFEQKYGYKGKNLIELMGHGSDSLLVPKINNTDDIIKVGNKNRYRTVKFF